MATFVEFLNPRLLPVARSKTSNDAAGFKVANRKRPSGVTARLYAHAACSSGDMENVPGTIRRVHLTGLPFP
jgi:hypothetical protein